MTQQQPQKEPKNAPLSFEAITAEIGDVVIPLQEDRQPSAPQETAPWPESYGTVIVDDSDMPVAAPEEDNNLRVLTGSSPQPRPMWVDGLLSAILAGLFIVPIVLRTGWTQYQPWISYMSMLLALGAGLWSLLGLRQAKTMEGKRMCYIAAGVSIVIVLAAFLLRAPTTAY